MKLHNAWALFNEYLIENRKRVREYGTWDCWQFVGGAVLVMTGVDYRERFPTYKTEAEGARIIAAHGGVIQMMAELFDPAKHVAYAQPGDIVAVDLGEGLAGGICLGVNTATVGQEGIELVPTLSGEAAWDI